MGGTLVLCRNGPAAPCGACCRLSARGAAPASGSGLAEPRGELAPDPHRAGARAECRTRTHQSWRWLQGRDYQPRGRTQPLRRQRAAQDSGGAPGAYAADAGGDAALATAADDPEPLPAPAGAGADAGGGARMARARRAARTRGMRRWIPWARRRFLPCVRTRRSWPQSASKRSVRLTPWPAAAQTRSATAERWARAELPLRLRCFENWLTERIRGVRGRGPL